MGGNSLIDRLFKRESTTKEEIRQLVDEDQAKGELEASQREMIHNIFDFDRLCAEDIMTHRTEIEAVEETATIGYAAAFALEAGCSRIPVFREDLDNVQGILYVKDLLPFVGKPVPAGTRLTDYVREPLFVPESIPCGKLFATMTDKRIQMAIVVDEYGGTAGLVTMEDILESIVGNIIVGNIMDEYDEEEADVIQTGEHTFTFDGSVDMDDAEKALGVPLPEGDYDTLAGFLISRLGYLPTGKETQPVTVDYENVHFTVCGVEERRIERIKAEVKV